LASADAPTLARAKNTAAAARCGALRIAVISPWVDRRHGTERALAELIERLAGNYQDSIDLYAQRVSDIAHLTPVNGSVVSSGGICWHRVPEFRAPHLLRFVSWLFLNRRARRRNRRTTGSRPDVIFSPGINALDADVILVHAVFHRLAELQAASDASGFREWHRKLYYSMLCRLEKRIYRDSRVALAAVSKHTAEQLARYFGRRDAAIIPNGVDPGHFSPATIRPLREAARQRWRCAPEQVVLLLVGNDWRNKGLNYLLEAMARLADLPLRLLVVGRDDHTPFRFQASMLGLRAALEFCRPTEDVRNFYAAADILAAPSLEDSFNLPVLEAMACGLPSIVSRNAGVSEWLTHGFDSLLLKNPENTGELAEAIRSIAEGPQLRRTLAENAVHTARTLTWDEHAAQLRTLLETAARKKAAGASSG
jgi:glycosyltransferase involved in cell wall biosynthesis